MKSVPRGKAIWNANGGFVSVLLTHLFNKLVEADKSFTAMLNTANVIPNNHGAEVCTPLVLCVCIQFVLVKKYSTWICIAHRCEAPL